MEYDCLSSLPARLIREYYSVDVTGVQMKCLQAISPQSIDPKFLIEIFHYLSVLVTEGALSFCRGQYFNN